MVLKPGKEAMAQAIFDKWELDFAIIGEVTDTQHMVLEFDGEVVCDIPLGPLAADAPEYDRPYLSKEDYTAWAGISPMRERPDTDDVGGDVMKLLASPNLSSRRWIAEQYDSQVGADMLQTGGDAGVVRVHGTKKALAITTDCTPRYVHADPYEGGKQAVAEAYRNLSAVGATPIAITDNLNFGNPEKPATMGYIVKAIEGMAEACRELDFPVVSGNVSLYNETDGKAIPPTPVVGGVGLIEDVSKIATLKGAQPGDALILIGETKGHLGASLYAREWLGLKGEALGSPPSIDLETEKKNADFVRELIHKGLVNAVHDVSDGGVACAAAEMALASGVRVFVSAEHLAIQNSEEVKQHYAALMFSETSGRYLVSAPEERVQEVWAQADSAGIARSFGGSGLVGSLEDTDWDAQYDLVLSEFDISFKDRVDLPLSRLREAHEGWLPTYMNTVD